MNGNGRKRGSAMHRAVDRLERFVESDQAVLAIALGALLLLVQIPPVERLVEDTALENSSQLRTAIGVILLSSILLELRQLKRRVTPVISDREHYPDPAEMYDRLKEKLGSLADPNANQDHWRIEVLGLTLDSAWPVLEHFLERTDVYNWTIRLATMSKDATETRKWVPEGWPKESETTVGQVMEFKARQQNKHHHDIKVFEYEFVPVVHGFRLGNEDVFLSTLRWRPEGTLGEHRFVYDYFPAHDFSAEATAARELFRNWFAQATEGPGDPAASRG